MKTEEREKYKPKHSDKTDNMRRTCPRILLAGTHSGVGKTTITCALLRTLQKRGRKLSAFKCGPDYIDPMFHREVLGVESGNLDSFFQSTRQLQESLLRHTEAAELAVIEGVMGYYDGIGLTTEASTAQVAQHTDTPVVLLVDCRGRSQSALAEVHGFVTYRPEGKQIRGVLLNRLPERLYEGIAEQIRAMGLRPVGYLPEQKEFMLQSRHLGLVTPKEIKGFQEQLDRLAEVLAATVDLDAIEEIAAEAGTIPMDTDVYEDVPTFCADAASETDRREGAGSVRIALAMDAAFCFYYRENIEILEALGAQIIPFSPLSDAYLPDCDALILPGGYPELYAGALEKNESMRYDIYRKIKEGLPTIAECGGFLYLHDTLTDADKKTYAGAGVLHAGCAYQGFQRQFGYITLTAQKDQLLARKGECLKGHEFHYFVSEQVCDAFGAEKPDRSRSWTAAYATDTLYAGFPHISFAGSPEAAGRFVIAAGEYHRKQRA